MQNRPKVIIVGSGFGGLAAAKGLGGANADVLLIDRTNHHLFQPLLYQVATAALSPADIATATRMLVAGFSNIVTRLDEVTGVDTAAREVFTCGRQMPYDTYPRDGLPYSFFGNDAWAEQHWCEDLAMPEHPERVLGAFEKPKKPQPSEITALLTS